jgi:hypothetical protein
MFKVNATGPLAFFPDENGLEKQEHKSESHSVEIKHNIVNQDIGNENINEAERWFKVPFLKQHLFSIYASHFKNSLKALPSLDSDSEEAILDLIDEAFTLTSKESDQLTQTTTIRELLEKFIHQISIQASDVVIRDVLIIGGMLNILLKPSYWKQIFSQFNIPKKKLNFICNLPKEPGKKLLGQRSDCDILLEVEVNGVKDLYAIKSALILTLLEIFKGKLDYETLEKEYFEKLEIYKGELTLVAKIKGEQGIIIEIKVNVNVKRIRSCLFYQDAPAISIYKLIKQNGSKPGPVICNSSNIFAVFYHHQTEQLWAEKPETVNEQGLIRLLNHLSEAKDCHQALTQPFKKSYLKKHSTFDQILESFQKYIKIHHAKDSSAAITLYFNACLPKMGLFTTEQKSSFWPKIDHSQGPSPALLKAINAILQEKPHLLEEVIAFMSFCAALHYDGHAGEWSCSQAMGILVTKFENEEHFKIVLHKTANHFYSLWLPCDGIFSIKKLNSIIHHFASLSSLYPPFATSFMDRRQQKTSFFKPFLTGIPEDKLLKCCDDLINLDTSLACHLTLEFLFLIHTAFPTLDLSAYLLKALPHALTFYQNKDQRHEFLKKLELIICHNQADKLTIFKTLQIYFDPDYSTQEEILLALITDLLQFGQLNHVEVIARKLLKDLKEGKVNASSFADSETLIELIKRLLKDKRDFALLFFEQALHSALFSFPLSIELLAFICLHSQNLERQQKIPETQLNKLKQLTDLCLGENITESKGDQISKGIHWLVRQIMAQNPSEGYDYLIRLTKQGWLNENTPEYEFTVLSLIETFYQFNSIQAKALWEKLLRVSSHYSERQSALICTFINEGVLLSSDTSTKQESDQFISYLEKLKLSVSDQENIKTSLVKHFKTIISHKPIAVAAEQLDALAAFIKIDSFNSVYKQILQELIEQKGVNAAVIWLKSILAKTHSKETGCYSIELVASFISYSLEKNSSLSTISEIGKFLKETDTIYNLFEEDLETKFSSWYLIAIHLMQQLKIEGKSTNRLKMYYALIEIISVSLLPNFYRVALDQKNKIVKLKELLIDLFNQSENPKGLIQTPPFPPSKYMTLLKELPTTLTVLIKQALHLDLASIAHELFDGIQQQPWATNDYFPLGPSALLMADHYCKKRPFQFQNFCRLLKTSSNSSVTTDKELNQLIELTRQIYQDQLPLQLKEAASLIKTLIGLNLPSSYHSSIEACVWQLVETCYQKSNVKICQKESAINELNTCYQKGIISRQILITKIKQLIETFIQQNQVEKALSLLDQIKTILAQEFILEDWTPLLKLITEFILKTFTENATELSHHQAFELMHTYITFFTGQFDTEWSILIKGLIDKTLYRKAWKLLHQLCHRQALKEDQTRKELLTCLVNQSFTPDYDLLKSYLENETILNSLLGSQLYQDQNEKLELYRFIFINYLKSIQIKNTNKQFILDLVIEKREHLSGLLSLEQNTKPKMLIDGALIEALIKVNNKANILKAVKYCQSLIPVYPCHQIVKNVMEALYAHWQLSLSHIDEGVREQIPNLTLEQWLDVKLSSTALEEIEEIGREILMILYSSNTYSFHIPEHRIIGLHVLTYLLHTYSPWLSNNLYVLDILPQQIESRMALFKKFCLACVTHCHLPALSCLVNQENGKVSKELSIKDFELIFIYLRMKASLWINHFNRVDNFAGWQNIIQLSLALLRQKHLPYLKNVKQLEEVVETISNVIALFIKFEDAIITSHLDTWKQSTLEIIELISSHAHTLESQINYRAYLLKQLGLALEESDDLSISKGNLEEILNLSFLICKDLIQNYTKDKNGKENFQVTLSYFLNQAILVGSSKAEISFKILFDEARANQCSFSIERELDYFLLCKHAFPVFKESRFLPVSDLNTDEFGLFIQKKVDALLESKHPKLFLYGTSIIKNYYDGYYNPLNPKHLENFKHSLESLLHNKFKKTHYQTDILDTIMSIFSDEQLIDKLRYKESVQNSLDQQSKKGRGTFHYNSCSFAIKENDPRKRESEVEALPIAVCFLYLDAFIYIVQNYQAPSNKDKKCEKALDVICQQIKEFIVNYKKIGSPSSARNLFNYIFTSSLIGSVLNEALFIKCLHYFKEYLVELRTETSFNLSELNEWCLPLLTWEQVIKSSIQLKPYKELNSLLDEVGNILLSIESWKISASLKAPAIE